MSKETGLLSALAEIKKKYGNEAITMLGDRVNVEVETISTGCLSLNAILGGGGMPRGRIVEIYGPESSGKTTLALHVVAEAQKNGLNVAYVDTEHALDPSYAEKLGVVTTEMCLSQPGSGEEALEIVEMLVRSEEVGLVVVDSVAALIPQAEINGEMGDAVMGGQARLMSQAMRKLTSVVSKTNTCLIFINQLRSKIGVVYGSPEVTTGGNALKFYASVRIDIRRIAMLKDSDGATGSRTRIKIVKNKLAPPFRECEVDIIYGEGISKEGDLIDLAIEHGVIKQSGSWYSLVDEKLGQGKDKVRNLLKSDQELYEHLVKELKERLNEIKN